MKCLESALAAAALGAVVACQSVGAQCRPPARSHEARLLAFYEAPIAFSLPSAPERLDPGAVRLGGEAVPVPSPDPALQHPEYCFANTTNNTKLAPLFGRPRLRVGFPAGSSLEVSYLPNVTVADAQANLVSLALANTQPVPLTRGRATVIVRADATMGRIRGAITCPRTSLQTVDTNVPCYGTAPSRDTFSPNSMGLETAVGVHAGKGLAVYAGGGARSIQPRFQAGFTDALGNIDRTRVSVNLWRGVAFAGATARIRAAMMVSMQIYSVPADVTTLRLGAEYALR